MLKCIGIDDEYSCNAVLEGYCSKIPFIQLEATFTDPYLAIPILEKGDIDLVFLDFYMSKVDAPTFIKYIPTSLKIIILSSELKSRIKEYDMPISEIISKPYPFDLFLSVVTAFYKKHKR